MGGVIGQFAFARAIRLQPFGLRCQISDPPVERLSFGAQGGELVSCLIRLVARGDGSDAEIP